MGDSPAARNHAKTRRHGCEKQPRPPPTPRPDRTVSFLELDRLAATALGTDPCAHVIVPEFLRSEMLPAIRASYPRIEQPGSFPISMLRYGDAFAALIEELEGPAFRAAIEAKFGIDLAGRPTMVTARGQSGKRDGKIHTDSKSKLVTVLIYLNEPWEPDGGRLRLLRSARDLEDDAVEVPPEAGLMLAFPWSERAIHGHKLFIGPRKVIQLNWVANAGHVFWDLMRHRLAVWLKRAA